ncbi:unnamed protein product, partial [Pelagomonas calceolata]
SDTTLTLHVGDDLRLQSFNGSDLDVLHQRVQLLGRLLVLVALPRQPHAHAVGHVPDALRPDVLVEFRVNSHIRRLHGLLGEFFDLADGPRRLPLEGDAVEALVEVDRVVARHEVGGFALALDHGL